jgi:DnaJ-class molecular chaperone
MTVTTPRRATNIVHGFNDMDCPECRGFGEHVKRRNRPCGDERRQKLRCRRCRGTGLI